MCGRKKSMRLLKKYLGNQKRFTRQETQQRLILLVALIQLPPEVRAGFNGPEGRP